MFILTPQLKARERTLVAVHEAAHEVLLHHFGGRGEARIWANPIPTENMKSWLGSCSVMAEPGQVSFARGYKQMFGVLKRPPIRWRRYVGLAGYVAAEIHQGATEAWEVHEAFLCALDADEISESDLEMVGETVNEIDFARTIRYLRTRWSDVEERASQLIRFHDEVV